MSLNPAQRQAVETLSGPLLVLAGAGTGKTRVVTFRIANLIRNRTKPERILAVTFTNKAAGEMQQRAAELLGKQLKSRPEISTFHSLCVRILRRQIQHLGYPRQFVIFDRGDQEGAARQSLREVRASADRLRPGDLLYFIGRWKTAGVEPNEAAAQAETERDHLAAVAYRRYQDALKTAGAVDFDDLLLLTQKLFDEFPQVRRDEARRFDHLLIDEYQDTNASQYRIVKALAGGHGNLCVVGDDDQSIYAWRGAEVEHILRFQHDWPHATVVRLEDNYRTCEAILEFANRLIAFNRNRHEKVLRASISGGLRPSIVQCQDETDEAAQTVADIKLRLENPAIQRCEIAILCRTNEQPRPFEMELRKEKLPYVLIGGQSFYDRREVKDLLAYLRVLDRPHDEPSLLRIINIPPRGIGQTTVKTLVEQAVQQGRPLWDVLANLPTDAKLTPVAIEATNKFRTLIESYRARVAEEPLSEITTQLITHIRYQDDLARQYPDANEQQSRWASVRELINALASYEKRAKKPTLRAFLDEVALGERDEASDKESKLNRNAIALMTLHAAKGLEFPHVYLVGLEEGLLPHQKSVDAEKNGDTKAIDEERRLCYVGVTRAKDRLTLSLALSRMKWGKARPTEPSRFLYELTGQAENRKSRTPQNAKKAPSQRHGTLRRAPLR
ncbi:MAG TPA: UvrD-helicase domain-containing protein [Pirellulales bacterium]|jgi:DNA helicase-2/ATP-dependent DNA helicase PcrA|nr:UvrD-helicase domain-containing protein [Pirellulales bacterium]